MSQNSEKLLNCFLEIEENSFPEYYKVKAKERSETVRNFIKDFGVDHVTVNNYTNMMQFLSSITIDTFNSNNWMDGNITIDLGSETHELFANRIFTDKNSRPYKSIKQIFNFKMWKWEEEKEKELDCSDDCNGEG